MQADPRHSVGPHSENILYFGDNLDVLRKHVKDDSADLIYLDPPFKSNQDYNVLFADRSGTKSAAQIQAFEDTWTWDESAQKAFYDTTEAENADEGARRALLAFRTLFGRNNDMLAYLSMMAPRLVELKRVLKNSGSLYLHCDPTASHYLKILMDSVFGGENFHNDLIWKRTSAHSSARKYAPVHDSLLFYTMSSDFYWNDPRTEYDQEYLDKYYKFDDGDGRLYWRADLCAAGVRHGSSGQVWRGIDPGAKGMHWKFGVETLDRLDKEGRIYWPKGGTMPQYKRYREELKGKPVTDIWDDIDRINPVGSERTGYPTQKPVDLLKRIIDASCPENGLVLDPFCGCGTAIVAAEAMHRRWIGIDVTSIAITLVRSRLDDAFEGKAKYEVKGEPTHLEEARALATLSKESRFQFQLWALGLVGARPRAADFKKGADQGIDGRKVFHEKENGPSKTIIISVKSGEHVSVRDVRELTSVVGREKAQIGALLTLAEPTRDMREEALNAGYYQPEYRLSATERYHKIQILTIAELLEGKRIQAPIYRDASYVHPPLMIPLRAERKGRVRKLSESLEGPMSGKQGPAGTNDSNQGLAE